MKNEKTMGDVQKKIDVMVKKAQTALESFLTMDQEKIDAIVQAMANAGLSQHMYLSRITVEETQRGILEDKVTKNIFATEYVYNSIKNVKTCGTIRVNEYDDTIEIAEPIGVVAAVTPVTNPTSTTMFKSLIAIKARNPIIFGFHPSAQQCSTAAAKILYDAAVAAGAPKDCIQWIEEPSIEATGALMNHEGVAIVLATGGSAMVNAAYSTGKPALGVGPGNTPCYVHRSANLDQAVNDIILSKSFDNGMICASEQAILVDEAVADQVEALLKDSGCYLCNEDEIKKLSDFVIQPNGMVNANVVGKYPSAIAEMAGFTVPEATKILVTKIPDVGSEYPLSREKLSPVLALIVVKNEKEGISKADHMLELGGLGHTAVIHAKDEQVIADYTNKMRAGRCIVNAPASQGAIGDIYNTLRPSLTLGCGSYGHNSTTENVSALNLVNIKRVAKRRNSMQMFKIPSNICFEHEATQYLATMSDARRAFVVTNQEAVDNHAVDKVIHYLQKANVDVQVYLGVDPCASAEVLQAGADAMKIFETDLIVAIGDSTVINNAKGMWLFYEAPEVHYQALGYKLFDLSKRIIDFPALGQKAKLVTIPTDIGSGNAVNSFATITDTKDERTYLLADYSLMPTTALIDTSYSMGQTKENIANIGIDILTNALESFVSIMASDYTRGLSFQSIELIIKWLPIAYKDTMNTEATNHLKNAATLAGMASSNAFLGINTSLANALSATFAIPHGQANAILLPKVIDFNANTPSKYVVFSGYEHFVAPQAYATIARALGLVATTDDEGVQSLIKTIQNVLKQIEATPTVRDLVPDQKVYEKAISKMAETAFEDQCTTANPRLPLIKELEEIYRSIY